MEIIIGRDPETSCLALLVDGKRAKDSTIQLPNSVSRLKVDEHTGHCRIGIKGDVFKLTNLNPQNVTYVDGLEISDHSHKVDMHSIITLGVDQYRLNLKRLLKDIGYVKPVSIKHLKRVWEKYDRSLLRMQVDQQKSANQQKLQGLISQASVLCVIIPSVIPQIPIPAFVRVLLVVFALALGIYFYVKGNKTDESFVVKKRELDDWFRDEYVCPECGYFFGMNTPYDSLEYKTKCPHCNTPLTT